MSDFPDDADLVEQVQTLLAQGQKIQAIKIYREATGAGLAEAKNAVEAIEQGPARSTTNSDFEQELLSLLEQGRKIEAIKRYREQSGTGLKEAKDAVDLLAARNGFPIKGSGCLGLVGLFMAGATMIRCFLIFLVSALAL